MKLSHRHPFRSGSIAIITIATLGLMTMACGEEDDEAGDEDAAVECQQQQTDDQATALNLQDQTQANQQQTTQSNQECPQVQAQQQPGQQGASTGTTTGDMTDAGDDGDSDGSDDGSSTSGSAVVVPPASDDGGSSDGSDDGASLGPVPAPTFSHPSHASGIYGHHDTAVRTISWTSDADSVDCSTDGATFAPCSNVGYHVWDVADYENNRTLTLRFAQTGYDSIDVQFDLVSEYPSLTFMACDTTVSADESFADFEGRVGSSVDGDTICVDANVLVHNNGVAGPIDIDAANLKIIGTESDMPLFHNLHTSGSNDDKTVFYADDAFNLELYNMRLQADGTGGDGVRYVTHNEASRSEDTLHYVNTTDSIDVIGLRNLTFTKTKTGYFYAGGSGYESDIVFREAEVTSKIALDGGTMSLLVEDSIVGYENRFDSLSGIFHVRGNATDVIIRRTRIIASSFAVYSDNINSLDISDSEFRGVGNAVISPAVINLGAAVPLTGSGNTFCTETGAPNNLWDSFSIYYTNASSAMFEGVTAGSNPSIDPTTTCVD